MTKKSLLSVNLHQGGRAQVASARSAQNKGHNQTVQTQSLSKDKNQKHSNEQLALLRNTTHTGITNDTNGHTGSQSTETTSNTSAQVREALEKGVLWADNIDAIDGHRGRCDNLATDDDSHNHGDNVLHDKFGLHHTHAAPC